VELFIPLLDFTLIITTKIGLPVFFIRDDGGWMLT